MIYTSLCLASMYCAVREKGWLSVIFFTLGFVFKMQSIFIIPALIICILAKKIKPIQLTAILAVLIVTALPALLAGRSIESIINIYRTQVTEYQSLVLNAPTVFQFVGNVEYEALKAFGIFLAGTVALIFVYLVYNYRQYITLANWIDIFYISAVIMPYFLPAMHDRYFFMADVLSIIVFMYNKRKWYVPVVTIFASFVSYVYFLMSSLCLIDQRYTALALLVVLILEVKGLMTELTLASTEQKSKVVDNGKICDIIKP